jgi:NADPH:quinone reductase-like Zn-dependent oxidoreductase
MKAIMFDRYGSADVLQLRDIPQPTPGDDDILVKVHAAPATRADALMRQANPWIVRLIFGLFRPRKPIVPGAELSGEVAAVGKNVTQFKPGDRIWASLNADLGALAEWVCISQHAAIAHMPNNTTYADASAMCEGFLTALTFLRDTAKIQAGQRLLINGASGSVGCAAVQLGKIFGAQVTGVCSTKNINLILSLGADEAIDYTETDFTQHKHKTYDIIFDTVGQSPFTHAKRVLNPGGIYLSPVLGLMIICQMFWTKMIGNKKAVIAFAGLKKPKEKLADMQIAKTFIESGQFKPVIDQRYPLSQATDAFRHVETGHKRGSVIIDINTH